MHARAFANDWNAQITSEPRAQYRPTGGLTPLLYAARSGCARLRARDARRRRADINQPNPDGVTPLMVALDNYALRHRARAARQGRESARLGLVGPHGALLAVDINTNGRAARAPGGETSAIDVVRRFSTAGVSPSPQLNMHRPSRGGNIGRFVDDLLTTGATPLIRAASVHDVESRCRLLLEHGALVDLPNVMGVTPLMAAAGMGCHLGFGATAAGSDGQRVETRAIASLESLLAAGADINVGRGGHS